MEKARKEGMREGGRGDSTRVAWCRGRRAMHGGFQGIGFGRKVGLEGTSHLHRKKRPIHVVTDDDPMSRVSPIVDRCRRQRGKDISQTECWCSHHSRDRKEGRSKSEKENGRTDERTNQEGKPFRGEERTKIKTGEKERKEGRAVRVCCLLKRMIVLLAFRVSDVSVSRHSAGSSHPVRFTN